MRDEPDVRLNEQVLEARKARRRHPQADHQQGERYSKTVIVCAGVGAFEPKRLDAPGVEELEGKGVHYFAKRVEDFRDKKVVIVGGGDSAVDWAVTLEPVATKVTVIHRSQVPRARGDRAGARGVVASICTIPDARWPRSNGRPWPPAAE